MPEMLKHILKVDTILDLKMRGSVLCGHINTNKLQENFSHLIGENVFFHSSGEQLAIKVVDIELKTPCFGDITNTEIIHIRILVDAFIDNTLRGNLFRNND